MLNILINGKEGKMLTKQDIEKIIENTEEEIETAKKDMLVLIDVISERNVIIREMKTELQKAKVDSVKTGYERREENGVYFIVTDKSEICNLVEESNYVDKLYYTCGNYMSRENAERMAKVTKLNFLLDRFTRENGWDDKLWEDDDLYKFFIMKSESLEVDGCRAHKRQGTIYFASREIAEQAIEKFRDLLEEVL